MHELASLLRAGAWFRARARAWFLSRPPIVERRRSPQLNPSNDDRRLVCDSCTPGRKLLTGNWYAVYCPRCGADAIEEMTPREKEAAQLEIDAHRAPARLPFIGIGLASSGRGLQERQPKSTAKLSKRRR